MWIALGVFLVSCLLSPIQLGDINWKTIFALFALMVVVKCYEELHLLSFAASVLIQKATNTRQIVRDVGFTIFFQCHVVNQRCRDYYLTTTFIYYQRKSTPKIGYPYYFNYHGS
jgi:Na+/H+ antiporter NhaD/arsenite permease-like protein